MCNLYDIGSRLRHQAIDDWERVLEQQLRDADQPLARTFGIRKTDPGLVILLQDTRPTAKVMRWGFQRDFNPAINNARTDKLDRIWADAWQEKRRCLIPMSTYYEWSGPTGKKQTFAFQAPAEKNLLWAAGLWETRETAEEIRHTYTMLTTAALGAAAPVHDRMPVILDPEDITTFLTAPDPRSVLERGEGDFHSFRCEKPLLNPKQHRGAVEQTMLPGFE